MAPRVFLITGCSTGFGRHYVDEVIEKGDICVATARDSSKLLFNGTNDQNYLALPLDVTNKKSISSAFEKAVAKFGRIDVVVNNAGYGLSGEFESLTEKEIRQQMEVNFFGLLDVTKSALEVMRETNKPQGGVIQQVTSIGGQIGVPSFSIYCASKWAVEGFSETVQGELKPEWNIHLTCIEPGGFRTDWSGRSMAFHAEKNHAYDHMDAQDKASKRHMTQAGDPPKASKAMYELAVMKDPPMRCALGTDAYGLIQKKVDSYRQNIEKFSKLTNSTDVDEN